MANLINSGITGLGGSYFGALQTVTVAACGGTYIIPKGYWYVILDANAVLQFNINGTWTTIPAGGILFSDGASLRLYVSGSTAGTENLIPITVIV
jgi:hypothetical protein